MSVNWPTRGPTRPDPAPWYRRLPSDDLRLLQAVLHLGAGRVPPWAGDLVTDLRAKADAAPEASEPTPAAPRPDDLMRGSDDFAAALGAAWSTATPDTRAALRVVAAALRVEVPADPERVQEPDPDPTGDQPTPDPETAPTHADTAPPDPPAPDPEPSPHRPRDYFTALWDVDDEEDEDPFEGRSPLGWANGV